MPWTIADVASHNKSVTDEDKPAWVKIANAVRDKCIKGGGTETMCDALAIATANKTFKEAEVEDKELMEIELEEVEISEDFEPLVEAGEDGTFLAKIISPGWGSAGFYSADVLKRDVEIYKEGLPMYWDHPSKDEEKNRPERSLRDMAGKLTEDAKYLDNGPLGPGVYAKAQAYTPFRAAIKEMQADIGLSHRATGSRKLGEVEGRKGPVIEKMVAAQSVDYVTAPGRGGAVTELFEAARVAARGEQAHDIRGEITLDGLKRDRPDLIEALRSEIKQAVYSDKRNMEEVKRMTDEEIKTLEESKTQLEKDNSELMEEIKRLQEREVLREAKELVLSIVSKSELPDITKDRLTESLSRNPITVDGKLDTEKFTQHITEEVSKAVAEVAIITESGKVKGMGESDATDGRTALKESFKRGYLREGYSDEDAERMAESAARGR